MGARKAFVRRHPSVLPLRLKPDWPFRLRSVIEEIQRETVNR
jgi:hypothetical protein